MPFPDDELVLEDLLVTGTLTVEDPGGVIQSSNYVAGVSGYQLNGTTAELNDVNVRGRVAIGNEPAAYVEIVADTGAGEPGMIFHPGGFIVEPIGADAVRIRSTDGVTFLKLSTSGVEVETNLLVGEHVITTGGLRFVGPGVVPYSLVTGEAFDLFHRTEIVAASPTGNDDANSAAFTNWGPALNVTAPVWATRALIDMSVTGVFASGGSLCGVDLRLRLDGNNGRAVGISAVEPTAGLPPRVSYSWHDEITGFGAGAVVLRVQEMRLIGVAAIRCDVDSDFSARVTWLP